MRQRFKRLLHITSGGYAKPLITEIKLTGGRKYEDQEIYKINGAVMMVYFVITIIFIIIIILKQFIHIENYEDACKHEWVITGAGFTVCRKCKTIH